MGEEAFINLLKSGITAASKLVADWEARKAADKAGEQAEAADNAVPLVLPPCPTCGQARPTVVLHG